VKVGILAGGMGTRLSEETVIKPKPMVEIGGNPILWHLMNIYSHFNCNDFVIALGYKGEVIKDYFLGYRHRRNSLSVDLGTGDVSVLESNVTNWRIDLLDTGIRTDTGGRTRQIAEFIGNEPFMLTYGDGVANVNVDKLLSFHKSHGKLATMTVVRPPSRFGCVTLQGDQVERFDEKPQIGEGWINGGFFVLEPGIIDYLDGGDSLVFERDPLERLASEGQLCAYKHEGFWQCMDTVRHVRLLNRLWAEDQPPWKVWKD
jgi:glucose-1-phosphate cytidylyltransferase